MKAIVWEDKTVTYQTITGQHTTKPFPSMEVARQFAESLNKDE
jgi:hypothetical protein